MKQSNLNNQKGFTLLELVVVVAVLGLIANLATEFVAHQTNQQRFETTKQRIDTIRIAIVGETGFSDRRPYVMAGYLSDMGEIPEELRLLISEDYCSDIQFLTEAACTTNVGTWENSACSNSLLTTELSCTTTNGTWVDRPSWDITTHKGWRGPYIRNADQQQQDTDLVSIYPDAWAGTIADLRNYDWIYTQDDNGTAGDTSDDTWTIQSFGLDRAAGTVSADTTEEFFYEQDFPTAGNNLLVNTTDHNASGFSTEVSITTGDICSINTFSVNGSSIESTAESITDPKSHSVSFTYAGNHALDIKFNTASDCGTGDTTRTEVIPVVANATYTYPIVLN